MNNEYIIENDQNDIEFMNLDDIGVPASTNSLEQLDLSIEKLNKTLNRYMNDCIQIWTDIIYPFSHTGDCLTLHPLDIRDMSIFLDFMKTQKTYKILITARSRLMEKRQFIIDSRK